MENVSTAADTAIGTSPITTQDIKGMPHTVSSLKLETGASRRTVKRWIEKAGDIGVKVSGTRYFTDAERDLILSHRSERKQAKAAVPESPVTSLSIIESHAASSPGELALVDPVIDAELIDDAPLEGLEFGADEHTDFVANALALMDNNQSVFEANMASLEAAEIKAAQERGAMKAVKLYQIEKAAAQRTAQTLKQRDLAKGVTVKKEVAEPENQQSA